MKHAVRYEFLARRLLAFAGTVALALTCWIGSAESAELFKEGAFSGRKPDLRNGEYLANAAGCAGCHGSAADPKILSGGLRMDSFIGTFFAPNITADASAIGGWTDAQFLNAVMFGIARDGRNLYPVMPYVAYAGMNPTDVLDIKAYLATLSKSDSKSEDRRVSFPYNLNSTISLWKRHNLTTPAFQPSQAGQLERGRYLVENVGACGECHTPRTKLFSRDDTRRFTGSKTVTGVFAPDISAARVASVGAETFGQSLFVNKTKLNGAPIDDGVMRQIAIGLGKLTDEDQRAIVAYLKGAEISAPRLASDTAAACKDRTGAGAGLDAAGGNAALARSAEGFVGKYCRNCHGPGESDQGSYPAGDLASIAADAQFVTPGDRGHSLLFNVIKSGRMPKGGRPSGEEIEQLGQWIDSLQAPAATVARVPVAAARKRQIVPLHATAEQALHDLGTLNAADKPFIRYVSFARQYNGTLPCEDDRTFAKRLELYDAGFNKLLNSMSLGPSLVKPDKVVGSRGLLARIDIRDLGWTEAKWEALVRAYPYLVDPKGDDALNALAGSTRTNLPILRADWFMANASRPNLYYPLLDLPDNISGVERQLGVDVNKSIRELKVLRAAFTAGSSGVSDHNRMIERHVTGRRGYYWKSYDFSSSLGTQSLTRHPHGPADAAPLPKHLEPFQHAGGEMIFSLPNGVQAYYLSKSNGDRLDEGPTSIVSFRQRPIGKGIAISNARSCFNCHADGIIAKRDQLRDLIKTSATFSTEQQDLLLKMYVGQTELSETYAADRAAFVGALDKIGATEKAPDGSLKSRSGPNGEEIITYYADLYEETLDEDALAAEFDLTREDFEAAVQRLDGDALKVAIDWLNQVKGGARIPREEFEQQYALLARPLTSLTPIKVTTQETKAQETPALVLPAYKVPEAQVTNPATQGAAKAENLALAIKIAGTDVKVNQKLSFDVIANKPCELQILYVDAQEKVTEIPQAMIGPAFLQAQTPRHVPADGSGFIEFDGAGSGETLLLSCREGGLGDQRLSADQAQQIAKKSYLPVTRSIAVHLQSSKPEAPTKPTTVDHRTLATQILTFNVHAE